MVASKIHYPFKNGQYIAKEAFLTHAKFWEYLNNWKDTSKPNPSEFSYTPPGEKTNNYMCLTRNSTYMGLWGVIF